MDKVDTSSSSSRPAVAQDLDETFYEEDEIRVISIDKLNPALNVTDQERSKLKLPRRWHDFFEESLPNLKNAIERRFLDGEVFVRKYGMSPQDALCTVDPTQSFEEKVKMYDRICLLNRKSSTDLLEGYPLYNDLVATVINESTSAFNTFSRLHEALTRKESFDFGAGKELVVAFEKAVEALDHWHKLLKCGIFDSFAILTLEFVSEQFNYFQNCKVYFSIVFNISSNDNVRTLNKQEKMAEHSTAADLDRRSIKSPELCGLGSFKTSKQKFKKLEPKIRKLIGKLFRQKQRNESKTFGASGRPKKANLTPTPVVPQKAKVVNEVKEISKTETETPKAPENAPESVVFSTQNKTEETGNVASNIKNNNNNIKTESPKPKNDLEKVAASQNSHKAESSKLLSSYIVEAYEEVKNYAVDTARKFFGWLLNADIVPREENSDRHKSNSVQQEEVEVVMKPEEMNLKKKDDNEKKNNKKATEMTEEEKKRKETEVKQKKLKKEKKMRKKKNGPNLILKM